MVSNPAYSGIQKRKYDGSEEQDTTITVKKDTLDNLIPSDKNIDLIKIDVEGGELGVLMGAKELIARCKPVIVFWRGLGAADVCMAQSQSESSTCFPVITECGCHS